MSCRRCNTTILAHLHVMFLCFTLAVMMLASGCSDDNGASEVVQPPTNSGNKMYIVAIQNYLFSPAGLNIAVGDTVRWDNISMTTHTTTSGTPGNPSGVWDSGDMKNGESFIFVFENAGEYPYYCKYYGEAGMTGLITVIEK